MTILQCSSTDTIFPETLSVSRFRSLLNESVYRKFTGSFQSITLVLTPPVMFQLFITSRETRKQLVQNNKPFLRRTSHLYQSPAETLDSTLMSYCTDAYVFLTCQLSNKTYCLEKPARPTCDHEASCGVSQEKPLLQMLHTRRNEAAGRNP